MDNRITKKRLGEMLSYDWLKIVVIAVVAVILVEVLFGVFGVKVSSGQKFEIILYNNVDSSGADRLKTLVKKEEALSFDVLSFQITSLDQVYYSQTLRSREETAGCDIVIIDNVRTYANDYPDEEKYSQSNMKNFIDGYSVYSFEYLIKDATEYLISFLKDGVSFDTAKNNPAGFNEFFDETKIENHFVERMKGDNRFKTEENKREGFALEKKRMEKLFTETCALINLFNAYKDTDLFVKYTKYEKSYYAAVLNDRKEDIEYNEQRYFEELEERKDLAYAVNLDFLEKDENLNAEKEPVSSYFKYAKDPFGEETEQGVKDLVLVVSNYKEAQPDLQFETITFLACLIRNCSTLLD